MHTLAKVHLRGQHDWHAALEAADQMLQLATTKVGAV